jgi:hypothetical protein
MGSRWHPCRVQPWYRQLLHEGCWLHVEPEACGAPVTEPAGAPPVTKCFKAQNREWRTALVDGREVRYEVAGGEVVTEGDITWGPVDEFEAALASGRSSFGKFKNGEV